jgi:leader peptidase (prepilin peptidase)/N-methyltransferase
MLMLIAAIVGIYGLFIGSFLNVVVFRVHAGKDFVKGRSHCPYCKHQLSARDLVPLFSWVALRGRCRSCRKPISMQYPTVELLTGALFSALYLHFQPHSPVAILSFVLWLYIAASFIVLSVYDLRWYLLPDRILLPIIVPALVLLLLNAVTTHHLSAIGGPILAAFGFGGAFYTLAAVSKGKWMGGGDIKLAFIMGLLLGIQKTSVAMFIAFDTAAIVGLALIIIKRRKTSQLIPFGPFLMGGALIALIYGHAILSWYVSITGLSQL